MKDQHPTLTPSAHPPALQTYGVSRYFGGQAAVKSVSLTVSSGSISGLIGPNGAGKSTFFDLLAGGQPPSAGEIFIHGHRVSGQPAHQRLPRGVGRTYQIARPFAQLSVLDNLLLGAQNQTGERFWANWLIAGRVRAEEQAHQAQARELLEFLTLDKLADQPAAVLSGGQRKLLDLGRILMARPRVILLDEPAAGVHPQLVTVIRDRILELNKSGITFLVIEHNMQLIASLCSHLFVMREGELLCEGPPSLVLKDPRVLDAYLGSAPL